MSKITIGITDCSKYDNYHRWIAGEQNVDVIRLSHRENYPDDISKCDGIVLTGGEDVHPRFYKKNEYLELCDEIDESRDEFEFKVLSHVEKNKLPLLGICRGLQVVNVYFGGTLLPHLPAFGKFEHSRTTAADRYHAIHVDPNSSLKQIVGSISGEINSAHHQSADLIGKGLVTSALSPDAVVEGLESTDMNDNFLLLVQWHPERMKDQENAFTKMIKQKFLSVVRNLRSAGH